MTVPPIQAIISMATLLLSSSLLPPIRVEECKRSAPVNTARTLMGCTTINCALNVSWVDAYRYALQALATEEYSSMFSTRLAHWYEIEALVRAGVIERAACDAQYFVERIGTRQCNSQKTVVCQAKSGRFG